MLFDDDFFAVHKVRGTVNLNLFNCIDFVILEKAKLFMLKAKNDSFEIELGCIYHYTDTDSTLKIIYVPEVGTINKEMDKIKGIVSKTGLGKMKHEIHNDTIIESCNYYRILKAKANDYTAVKSDKER